MTMNTKIVKKLLAAAVCGWLIAFILGYGIAGDLFGIVTNGKEHRLAFWIFMSLAPGGLGGIITAYIYEQLSEKDNK